MVEELKTLTAMQKIAQQGEKIYAEKYKQDYEQKYSGKFAVIDVLSGKSWVAEFPENALEAARAASPNGVFHLIRIGSPGAFKVSRIDHHNVRNWPF